MTYQLHLSTCSSPQGGAGARSHLIPAHSDMKWYIASILNDQRLVYRPGHIRLALKCIVVSMQ